jgi:excinuclease ABC subunit A
MPRLHPSQPPACSIEIRGARQNNLRGFDLSLPLGKLIVVSGPSGSGKSSLAFETLYAEGQRRYVETFSPYTRQFFDRMDRPAVDEIRGIPPAIAIEQVNAVKSTRSTVGTMTDLNDYLKLLLPRVVEGFCPSCKQRVQPQTASSIGRQMENFREETVLIAFPIAVPKDASSADFLGFLQQQGFQRFWDRGKVHRTDEPVASLPPQIFVIQDRMVPSAENRSRLAEALEAALRFGKGQVVLIAKSGLHRFSTGWHCAACDAVLPEPTPARFSFNHPQGACAECRGFGRIITLDILRAIPDRSLSIAEGAIKPFQTESGQECQQDLLRAAKRRKLNTRVPFHKLSEADQAWVFHGEHPTRSSMELWKEGHWYGVRGYFDWLESRSYKMHVRVQLSRYRNYTLCPSCNGGRFAPGTLHFRWKSFTAPELLHMSVDELHALVLGEHTGRKSLGDVAKNDTTRLLLEEVESRLRYLREVGLGYLTLDRPTRSLSGGETARVNLTTCLGTALVHTLFVLDEPSIGLHPRDTERLLGVLCRLRDRGNTLVVVEHEEAVIRAADHLVEIGPGRGEAGGHLVHSGPLQALISGDKQTLTGDYLTGKKSIPVPQKRRSPKDWIRVEGASANNLQNVTVDFPLGVLAGVSGVSGSGKSTLVHHVLYRHLARAKGMEEEESPGICDAVCGAEKISSVVLVDQSPLSRTPRSSPALYLGIFDSIRNRFAATEAARAAGLSASAFSFNTGTGRCERCGGSGFEKIEMQFLSDVFVKCPECEGRRFQPHVRQVLLGGKSIDEVLGLTISEAIVFTAENDMLDALPALRTLAELGLGYLRLGQPLNGLSGGESQRLKLAERLLQRSEKNALLILDEPTSGLHFDDIVLLLGALHRLVDEGHSVLLIEHNLEVLRACDYLLDMGPEAGAHGGRLVASGTPEQLARCKTSHTGRFLSARNSARAKVKERPSAEASPNGLEVIGARHHNLKNLSLRIPADSFCVVTGLSGSGKSTLAFDLLFAEGQRRFLDSMSPYARQFATQLERPDVDRVAGLPPTVAIEQRLTRGGGKSTVATVTEVYHFLRLLFAKLGVQHCPECEVAVEPRTLREVARRAAELSRHGSIRILAPMIKARKGFHSEVAAWALKHGFTDLLVDGKWEKAARFPKLDRFREHTLELLVGSISANAAETDPLLRKIVERALEMGKGTALLLDAKNRKTVLSTQRSCPSCNQAFEELDPRLFSFNSPHGWCRTCTGFGEIWRRQENTRVDTQLEVEMDYERQNEALEAGEAQGCPECEGSRLNRIACAVKVGDTSLDKIIAKSALDALDWLKDLRFSGSARRIADDILPEIKQRLQFLEKVGLGYLHLQRSAKTLSGGESQRIRLAAQLGSNLRGVLYVLDEPTIGLHPRDNASLLDTLEALKSKGNALLVVEHDEETLRRADHVIDLGPGAGKHGGEIVAQGRLEDILSSPDSVTGACLRAPLQHPMRGERRTVVVQSKGARRKSASKVASDLRWLELCNATLHNVRNVNLKIPIGRLTVLCGISGSGKSTLMRGLLKPAVTEALAGRKSSASKGFASLKGSEFLEAVYEVDQSPIGKTSRSTPATYLGIFDQIRTLFASTPLARIRGYEASRFSFNAAGGRCETCSGQGTIRLEMNFLPPAHIVCTDCGGSRYNASTLEVRYQERSIAEIMEMPMEEAVVFFAAQPAIVRPLRLLCETGLGYLTLGQASQTLSGGEAQRLKLVTELARGVGRSGNLEIRRNQKSRSILYLLEEPTIGLHTADVRHLLGVLHRLVDAGNTVVVIEHHTAVIAEADHIVEVGPEAGQNGGEIIAEGTPEHVAHIPESRIGPFLSALVSRGTGDTD